MKTQNVTEQEKKTEEDGFSYTYSAKEQEELRKIRQKYQPKEENKMEALRKLDAGVTQKATSLSIMLGVIGALILGTGMSLAMTDIGIVLGMTQRTGMVAGIVIGIVGIVFVCLAFPVYHHILKTEREKIAPEILRLTEELMK